MYQFFFLGFNFRWLHWLVALCSYIYVFKHFIVFQNSNLYLFSVTSFLFLTLNKQYNPYTFYFFFSFRAFLVGNRGKNHEIHQIPVFRPCLLNFSFEYIPTLVTGCVSYPQKPFLYSAHDTRWQIDPTS